MRELLIWVLAALLVNAAAFGLTAVRSGKNGSFLRLCALPPPGRRKFCFWRRSHCWCACSEPLGKPPPSAFFPPCSWQRAGLFWPPGLAGRDVLRPAAGSAVRSAWPPMGWRFFSSTAAGFSLSCAGYLLRRSLSKQRSWKGMSAWRTAPCSSGQAEEVLPGTIWIFRPLLFS